GEGSRESDIDLLVLTTRRVSWKEEQAAADALYDDQLRCGVMLSPVIVPDDEWENGVYQAHPLRREVERAGFHVLEERCTSLPFEVVFQSTGRSVWVQRFAGVYHLMARMWPELFAYQFILEAEIETLDDEATAAPAEPE
ncbi:MAG: hypothetical protein IH973_15170, partial [Myxococcales bacterium]|nr:hypothetical protein [Myxococcales bacterium]